MVKRGRPSAEDKLVVIEGSFGKAPAPPDELTDAQKEIWREVISSEPIDFFNTAALRNLLKDYCRHRSEAERVSRIINMFQDDWMKPADGAKRMGLYLRMRDAETNAAAKIATKLRLTNQSRYTPQAAATASQNTARGIKPWEV